MPVVAIPAVAVACLALLALLILWGAKAFGQALASFIPKDLPVLGDKLHNFVLAFITIAEAAVTWIMASFIRPAINWVLAPVYRIIDFIDSTYALARTVATSWSWLLNSALPAIIRKLEGYAHSLVVAARAYTLHLYRLAQHYAASLYHRATAYAARLYHAATARALALYHLARTYAHDLVHAEAAVRAAAVAAARVYAHDIAHAVSADLGKAVHVLDAEIKAITSTVIPDIGKAVAAGVKDAETFATAAAAGAVGALVTDVDKAIEAVVDGLIIDIGVLEGVIGTDLPDIGDLVHGISRAIPTDLAGALGLSFALERVMARYMARCGIPNCRNLSKIGRDLQELFKVLEGGAFLGLLAYMVGDPGGAAREAESVLGPIANGTANAARNLIGV